MAEIFPSPPKAWNCPMARLITANSKAPLEVTKLVLNQDGQLVPAGGGGWQRREHYDSQRLDFCHEQQLDDDRSEPRPAAVRSRSPLRRWSS